jgi:hypothetical protein
MKRPRRYRYMGWTYWQARRGHWILEHPTRGREWHHSKGGCEAFIRSIEAPSRIVLAAPCGREAA